MPIINFGNINFVQTLIEFQLSFDFYVAMVKPKAFLMENVVSTIF